MARFLTAVGLTMVLTSVLPQAAGVDWQWRSGRATHYGGPGDPWSIMTGSCGYGYLDEAVGTGWDVAAMIDVDPSYAGSCGRCYEIACDPTWISDGYGQKLDRSSICYDSSASLVVMISDTCPCYYPSNAYSNKRWCCGDTFHLDISTWAFEKLAEVKYGVIGMKFREVPCSYRPSKPATLPVGKERSWQPASTPSGWQASWDQRPKTAVVTPLPPRSSFTDGNVSASAGSWSTNGGGNKGDDSSNSGSSAGGGSSGAINIWYGGLQPGWSESQFSWSSWSWQDSAGTSGGRADCGTVYSNGGTSFQGSQGSFSGKTTLEFKVKKVDNNIPAFTVKLRSSKGDCRAFQLNGLWPNWQGDWIKFTIYLGSFSWDQGWQSSPVTFNGCSSNIGAWDVNKVELSSTGAGKWLCIDALKIY